MTRTRTLCALLAFFALLGTLGRARAWAPPTLAERAIVEQALRYSPLTADRYRDPFALLEVLRLEEHPNIRVPSAFRGMSLAASYRESVWKTGAVGDGGNALGWAQMHRWHHRACNGFDRLSPAGSMRCWLWRIRETYERKVRRRCERDGFGDREAWIASWRWVARGGKFPGCEEGDPRLHLSQLRCWSDGERHSGICKGRRGGWKGELSRYVQREYGPSCNEYANLGAWAAYR